MTEEPNTEAEPPPLSPREAARLQRRYAASRRAWAETVGRPYMSASDPRPPPGEIDDGGADE